MKYFIYATEVTYKGLHGVYDQIVDDFNSETDAYERGLEMAMDLIGSHEELLSQYEDEYEDEDERWNAMQEDCCVEVYTIKPEFCVMPSWQLDDIAFNQGVEWFVKIVCEEIG